MEFLPENLVGKIKSLSTVDSNNAVEYKEFDKDGRLILRKITENEIPGLMERYEYDSFGNTTLYEMYTHLPEISSPGTVSLTEGSYATYNDQNLLIFEETLFVSSGQDYQKSCYYHYLHDISGKITRKVKQDTQKNDIATTEYTYFENGQLQSEITISHEDHEYQKFETYYDESGLVVKQYSYIDYKDGSPVQEVTLTLSGKEVF